MGERAKIILNEYSAKSLLMRDTLDLDKFYTADLKLFVEVARKEIKRLNNIINEFENSKEKQINEYEILILKIERYLNCYQYFLETQEENNKKIANMIHEFSLGSDKE